MGKKIILVLEKDSTQRALITHALERAHQVLGAGTRREAELAMSRIDIDTIIVDIDVVANTKDGTFACRMEQFARSGGAIILSGWDEYANSMATLLDIPFLLKPATRITSIVLPPHVQSVIRPRRLQAP